tara:strand:+ start:3970 stop:5799 length:1830 start_codon:yes stop_codon:yes gene_type:complete
MPILSNNSLDDPLILDGNNSFVGGQVSASRANLVPQDAYAEGKNIDLDEFGNAVTRRGTSLEVGYLVWEDVNVNWESENTPWEGLTAPITSLGYFDTGSKEYIAVADGANYLKCVTEDGSFTSLTGATYPSGANVRFAQLNDKLYYTDGSSDLRYLEGSTDPVTAESITAGKITSISVSEGGSGYTSPPTVTIDAPSSGVTATGTAVLGYDGSVVSVTMTNEGSGYDKDNPPSVSFSTSSGTDAAGTVRISQTPSKPKFIVSHTNRLFATSADTAVPSDILYVSGILDGESWDLAGDNLRVGNDRDPITALMPAQNFDLYVFKERSIYKVTADPTLEVSQWSIKLINNRTGCVADGTVQQVGADIMFLSRDGVRSLQSIQAGTETDISMPISRNINDYIGRINQAAVSTCTAVYWRNRYMLSVPLDSATTPDTVLTYNLLAGAWCGFWTGWEARDFVIAAFNGQLKMNMGTQNGELYTWDDTTPEASTTIADYKDGNSTYESYISTRAYTYGETWGDKIGYSSQFNFGNIHTDAVTGDINYYKDLSSSGSALDSSLSLAGDTNLIRKGYNMISKGRFDQMQFRVKADGGRLSLHSIQTSAFGQPIDPQK